jgi:hypothetical protein
LLRIGGRNMYRMRIDGKSIVSISRAPRNGERYIRKNLSRQILRRSYGGLGLKQSGPLMVSSLKNG